MTSDPDPTADAEPTAPADRRRRTVTGLGLVVGGALVGMLAMTALPWYRGSLGGFLAFGTKVSDLRETIAFYQSATDIYDVVGYGVSPLYFQWLAIALLILAALLGAATIGLDGRASRSAAVASATVATAGVVLTALAIQLIDIDAARLEKATGTESNPPGYLDFLGNTSVGPWAMAAGFVAIAVGAVLASGGRDAMRSVLADEPEPEERAGDLLIDDPPADEPGVQRENW